MKMEIKNMKENIKMENGKEKEYYMIKMEINYMKEIIKMVYLKEKE